MGSGTTANAGATARQRVIQPGGPSGNVNAGSLTSRFPNNNQLSEAAGVFSYHDHSTYSSTIDDESKMMKT